MKWIDPNTKLPQTTLPKGKSFRVSKFMVVYVKGENFPSTARFEKGDTWEQWFCPVSDDAVEVDLYLEIPDKP